MAKAELIRFTDDSGSEQWLGSLNGADWATWDDPRLDFLGPPQQVLDPGVYATADLDAVRRRHHRSMGLEL